MAQHNGPVPLSEAFPGTTWRIPEQCFPTFWFTLVTVASIPDPADHCICYTHLAHFQLQGYIFCLPVFWCPSEEKMILFSFISNICMQNNINESPIVMWYFLNRTVLKTKKIQMQPKKIAFNVNTHWPTTEYSQTTGWANLSHYFTCQTNNWYSVTHNLHSWKWPCPKSTTGLVEIKGTCHAVWSTHSIAVQKQLILIHFNYFSLMVY